MAVLVFASAAAVFSSPASAEPSLRAYSRIDIDGITYQYINLDAPPLPLDGLDINTSFGGGTTVLRGDFASISLQTHGFYVADDLGNVSGASNHHGGIGVLTVDDLVIDAEGLTGQTGYLVSKVRITGKLPNQDYSLAGTAGYFGARLSVSWGFYGGGIWSSAATIQFSTVDGLTGEGFNADTPALGGTVLNQVLRSARSPFTFGQWAGFSLYADVSASGAPQVAYTDATGTWNFGTAADPVLVEWAGFEVYDADQNLIANYTAKSASGHDYSLGQSVPQPPPLLTLTKESATEYKLGFLSKSYLKYQLQGSLNLFDWNNIGGELAGDGLFQEISDTRATPAFFWKLVVKD